jgi:hypothetical protein
MSVFKRLACLLGAALLGGLVMGILAWLIGGSVLAVAGIGVLFTGWAALPGLVFSR